VINVLLVDDDPDVRSALHWMLEAGGFGVLDAAEGTAALKQIAIRKVDVVVADLLMPGMDGLSLINHIASWPAPRPGLVAITGQTNLAYKANLEAARLMGADIVLLKPVSEAELRTAILRLAAARGSVQDIQKVGQPGFPAPRQDDRTVEELRASSIIQVILTDLTWAAEIFEKDLQNGIDPEVIGTLLSTAQTMALGRGIDLRLRIQAIRTRLYEAGYPV
jgi:CheY-like chemotaxis protein